MITRQLLDRASKRLGNYKKMSMDELCHLLHTIKPPPGLEHRPCGSHVRAVNRITRAELDSLADFIKNHNKYTLREIERKINKTATARASSKRKTPKIKSARQYYIQNKRRRIIEYQLNGAQDQLNCMEKLGSGGYGTVYKCNSRLFGNVALKTYKGAKRNIKRHFKQELYMLDKISPYKIYAGVAEGNDFYIITEYIDGSDIHNKKFSNSKILQLVDDIVPILQKAHTMGIAHMDIKPENILYDSKKGKFILVDWGIACFMEDAKKYVCNPKRGTKHFLSPWMLGHLHAPKCPQHLEFARNDQWALGITLYELATGDYPHITYGSRPKITLKSTGSAKLDKIIGYLLDLNRDC